MQASTLDRLSNDVLRLILDFAMARDSPFYIDDPRLGKDPSTYGDGFDRLHDHTLQPIHRKDWIAVNSTSRRIRALGKVSFFSTKTFAIHNDFPTRLQRHDPNNIKGMMLADQALALAYIRDIIIVNTRQTSPTILFTLPQTLAAFPCLRRCTLLFGFIIYDEKHRGAANRVEWITAASVLARPIPLEMQEYMVGIGIPRYIRLEETIRPSPGANWQDHQKLMEENIYPALKVKAKLLQAKKERERSATSLGSSDA